MSRIGLGLSLAYGLKGGANGIVNPLGIANCTLWLRGDLGVTNASGKASAWADQSTTTSTYVQGTAANQLVINPTGINSRQTLTGSAVSTTLMTTATTMASYLTASAWTMFAVGKNTGTLATQTSSWVNSLIFGDSTALVGLLGSNANVLGYNWDGADKSNRIAVSGGTAFQFGAQLSGGQLTAAIGSAAFGGAVATGNLTATTGAGRIGGGMAGGNYWTGEIGEIIAYNRALSAGEISQVQTYLHNLWGT